MIAALMIAIIEYLGFGKALGRICPKALYWKRNQSCKRHRRLNRHYHSPNKPEWLREEILRLKAHMPDAGCRTITNIINRRFATTRKVTVGKTFVHKLLQQNRYEIESLRRHLKHRPPAVTPHNHIWGIDFTGKTDAQGRLYYLLGIVDHGSRKLLHLQPVNDKTPDTVLTCIQATIKTYGQPRSLRPDNEDTFTCPAFRIGLKQLGIRHQRTTPGCPWQNGRIERLFGTLKQKLDQLEYLPLPLVGEGLGVRAQLNHDLNIFCHWYNSIRPHQNLGGQTPDEAWRGINPYKTSPRSEHWFTAWEGLLTGVELRC